MRTSWFAVFNAAVFRLMKTFVTNGGKPFRFNQALNFFLIILVVARIEYPAFLVWLYIVDDIMNRSRKLMKMANTFKFNSLANFNVFESFNTITWWLYHWNAFDPDPYHF